MSMLKIDEVLPVSSVAGGPKLGMKDAIHVPVMVVRSKDDWLDPGDRLFIIDDGEGCNVMRAAGSAYHGVVSPFIRDRVPSGTMFLMILSPEMIDGSVRHEFDLHDLCNVAESAVIMPGNVRGADSCAGCY